MEVAETLLRVSSPEQKGEKIIMQYELTSIILGHALIGTLLAIFVLATAFWLAYAFRSARMAIRELSALNQTLQTGPTQLLQGRAP